MYKNTIPHNIIHFGTFKNYNFNSAYYLDIPVTKKDITIATAFFEDVGWFNENTEFFKLAFNGYNYNSDVFITVSLTFEQSSVGTINPTFSVCTISLLQELKSLSTFSLTFSIISDLIINIVVVAYCFYNIYAIIRDNINGLLKHYKQSKKVVKSVYLQLTDFFTNNVWNFILCAKICLFFSVIIIRVVLYINLYDTLKYDNSVFMETDNICDLMKIFTVTNTVMICVTFIYFLRYLDENIVNPVFETLYLSRRNISVFLLSYAFTITGYSMLCNFVFGYNISGKVNFK
jgi:hypothetical protein